MVHLATLFMRIGKFTLKKVMGFVVVIARDAQGLVYNPHPHRKHKYDL